MEQRKRQSRLQIIESENEELRNRVMDLEEALEIDNIGSKQIELSS